MSDLISKSEYCKNQCRCSVEACDKKKCPIWLAPTVEAEPVKHGHWIIKKTAADANYTICSHCNTSIKFKDEYGIVLMDLRGAPYCPACGAKMDEPEVSYV